MKPSLKSLLLAATTCAVISLSDMPTAGAFIVFDPSNYSQNLLTAARSLQEVQNQIKEIEQQVQMLTKMDLNLSPLGSSIAGDLQKSLGEVKDLMAKADGIALSVQQMQSETQRLFPTQYAKALSNDQSLALASERWSDTLDAFKRSMATEAKVVESVSSDGSTLDDLLSKSQGAVGNLEVQQAGNQLLGLSIKQQLQLQNLLAANQNAQNLDRATGLSAQQEAKLRFKTFMGSDQAYTP